MATETGESTVRGTALPLVPGALAGGAAWLVSYLLTYVLTSGTIQNSGLYKALDAVNSAPPVWKLVGWLFYNAHVVNSDVPGLFGTTSVVNFISRVDAFSPVLYVVPPALLLAAGIVTARRSGLGSVAEAATSGATVVVGYLPLSIVIAFLVRVPVGQQVAGPDLLTAVLLAGVLYPLVCGAVGGAIAQIAD